MAVDQREPKAGPTSTDCAARSDFDRQPIIARIETDRFCDCCGYNLRTQHVRRDPGTQLLLCRCPECGQLHPVRDQVTAGRVWLNRLGTLALFLWMLVVLPLGFGLGAAQVGISIIPLEELTNHQRVSVTVPPITPATPIGTLTTMQTTTTYRYRRAVRTEMPYYKTFMALVLGLSLVVGVSRLRCLPS